MEKLVDLYISQQKSQLLDSLETQVRFSQLVAIIVGEKGVGKSFFLECLQQRLKDEIAIASVDASLAMSEDQLDKTISLQLGLSWQESESSISQRIDEAHSQKVLICIDDAHLLSQNCLEYILRINQSPLGKSEPTLFILLVGDKNLPQIISKTKTFTEHPDMCVVFEIEPIQKSETSLLVESLHHSNVELLKGLKENAKLDYFWQLAKGNPAELNYHISRWLDDHSPTQVVEVKSQSQSTYLKASIYGLIAISLVSMLIYQNDINRWITGDKTETDAASEEALFNQEKVQLDAGSTQVSENDFQEVVTEQISDHEKEKAEQNKDSIQNSDSSVSAIKEKQLAKETVQKAGVENLSVNSDKAATNERKTKVKEKKTEHTTEQQKKLAKQIVEAETPQVIEHALTNDELALLKRGSAHFVLQWAGLSSQDAAEQYRNKHAAKDTIKIYRRNQGNKILYLVISDNYSNRALAEFAKNNYLQNGVKEKPWVKSLAQVQKEIQMFKK